VEAEASWRTELPETTLPSAVCAPKLTRDEARRIAANIAKLPDLLDRLGVAGPPWRPAKRRKGAIHLLPEEHGVVVNNGKVIANHRIYPIRLCGDWPLFPQGREDRDSERHR
jgi:hypothetical protein